MIGKTRAFTRDLWALTRPYWFSEERWVARGLLAVIVGLNLALVYLNVLFNEWNNLFYNALQNHDVGAFWHQLFRFSWLAALFIAVAVYRLYLNQMLQIRWRRWLTERLLGEWLGNQTYYRLQFSQRWTDNPDQRIADDLQLFVASTLSLSLGLLSSTVTLVSFLGILWALSGPLSFALGGHQIMIPGYMVWAAVLYAVVGSWLTHVIGRPLTKLNFDQQRFEADFRFSLVRFRENAEGIALYGGEDDEHRAFAERFAHVVKNWWGIMRQQKSLTWFTSGYGQLAIIFPIVVAAPRYFAKTIQLGGLMQTASAFGQVQDALSWFINVYPSIAEWRATVTRLTSFRNAMVEAGAAASTSALARAETAEPALAVEGVELSLPQDPAGTLVRADLRIDQGEHVLITGPSGSGKSTLFRAFAGLWPFGRGTIRLPGRDHMLFLPQKPYLPIASLRNVVSYPSAPERFGDDEIRRVLDLCRLGQLTTELDEKQHWANRLSPGEQQRVAIARALLHRPSWLFLDEATSAMDPEMEAAMYRLLRAELPRSTVVSIGHHGTLAAYHDRHLSIGPDGAGAARLAPIPVGAVAD